MTAGTSLFERYNIGPSELRNRIVMAPMTRGRAGEDRIPNSLMSEYYCQRSSAGLIVTEATTISDLRLLLEIFGSPISWVGLIWYLAALVIATKEATDLDYKFAGVSVLIGFAVAFVVRLLLGASFGLLSGVFV